MNNLLPTVWIMRTADGWYPIQPSEKCTPEGHAKLNEHVTSIEDIAGKILWRRTKH